MDLSFHELATVNRARSARWHGAQHTPWSGADWSNAVGGECGEMQNVVKKLRRLECGIEPSNADEELMLLGMLAFEMADVVLYLDLLAEHYGIDLPLAVRTKFNIKSVEQGFPERL